MKRISTFKTLVLVAGMLLTGLGQVWAGDGTKASPYTVAELNAQKDELAASGQTVWVKADLKGLGEDGARTDNADTEEGGKTVKHMAALFGDDTGTFVAYSWAILGQLALSDLTNTKELLISLNYGTAGHPYGNTANPQYASNEEPTDAHFSLEEVHNALSVTIDNDYLGYHIPSCYIVPQDVIAVKVSAGFTSKNGAYVNCENLFDGAEQGYVTPKNAALILLANKGTYDFVLSAALYEQKISNGNALNSGVQDGFYKKDGNFNSYYYRFVNEDGKLGFERNSDNKNEVTLKSKSEVYLSVSSLDNNFYGNWSWETDDKKWISWTGKKYSDYHQAAQATIVTFDFTSATFRDPVGTALADVKGNIYNETFIVDNVSFMVTAGSAATKLYVDSKVGQNLVTYKDYCTMTFLAPEGYAIQKIDFALAKGNFNFSANSGAIEGTSWTGNADGVRFSATGTTNMANAIVTLVAKDGSTTVLPAIEYTECANIAAFNALAAGTYARVTLTDAEVTGISADGYSTAFIQDATGGCWIQYTSLNAKLTEKTKVNGFVYVVARPNSGNVQMKEAEATVNSEITVSELSDYTIAEGTIAEVNVPANLNKVVKITGATLEETSATAGTLTQGGVTIAVNNGAATANQQLHKIAEWAKGTKLENVTIVAILVGKSATENQLLPISITTGGTGIANVHAVDVDKVAIYNLQGVRMNQLQRGLNIVNGKKVVIK